MMRRELRTLYNRIKDYDIESLQLKIITELQSLPVPKETHKNKIYNHEVLGLIPKMGYVVEYISLRNNKKRITLEEAMSKYSEEVEKLLGFVEKAIMNHRCIV